jgi:tetraacyldisaccharide 4'-kinase
VNVLTSAEQAGDEPQLLAENLKGIASVICDSDRAAAGQWAIENLGADVLVLDDGYQHLQLTRDLNIAIIDATNPWGEGQQLPYGMLREPRSGLSRADCVVITRAGKESDPAVLKGEINRFTAAPIFTSRMQTSLVRKIDAVQPTEVTAITQPFAAFCGVGNPSSFFNHLRREGFILAHTHAFPDHNKYQQADLDNLCQAAKTAGAGSLITTAKDAVKLREFSLELPCYVLEIEIVIDQQDTLIDLIRGAITPRV